MWGGWPESRDATALVADETAVAVETGAMVVVEVVDVEVATVGGRMGGASVACEGAAPSPPHAANDSNATAVQARQPQRQE
jgi:hypothetical protein